MPNAGSIALTEILPSDVLLGRGKLVHHHMGNVVYRNEVKRRSREFLAQSSLGRDAIARDILENVHRRGGRFLRPIVTGDAASLSHWETCPIRMALTKVKQALRDVNRQDLSTTAIARASEASADHGASLQGATMSSQEVNVPASAYLDASVSEAARPSCPQERTSSSMARQYAQVVAAANLDSSASGAARLLDPQGSAASRGRVQSVRFAKTEDAASAKLGPNTPQGTDETDHSAFDGPRVGFDGQARPQSELATSFYQDYQPQPTIASLQYERQLRRSGLANYILPGQQHQGPMAHYPSSLLPQGVLPLSSPLYQHLTAATPRSQINSGSSNLYAASSSGAWWSASQASRQNLTQEHPEDSYPPDQEMSELLRRLRDGA